MDMCWSFCPFRRWRRLCECTFNTTSMFHDGREVGRGAMLEYRPRLLMSESHTIISNCIFLATLFFCNWRTVWYAPPVNGSGVWHADRRTEHSLIASATFRSRTVMIAIGHRSSSSYYISSSTIQSNIAWQTAIFIYLLIFLKRTDLFDYSASSNVFTVKIHHKS